VFRFDGGNTTKKEKTESVRGDATSTIMRAPERSHLPDVPDNTPPPTPILRVGTVKSSGSLLPSHPRCKKKNGPAPLPLPNRFQTDGHGEPRLVKIGERKGD